MDLKRSTILLIVVMCALSVVGFGQKRPAKQRYGKVCGDPTVKCKGGENFQPGDLPFDTGRNFVIYESEQFYGIVLKSTKLPDFGDCANPSFKESERSEIQKQFEHNKVFVQNCMESGSNYYTGVADNTAFIGVYAGRTLVDANALLKKVQASGLYPGVKVRKMRIGVNGT
jgi:hypothetical protein